MAVSVVLATTAPHPHLEQCLTTLRRQHPAGSLEILWADSSPGAWGAGIAAKFPEVRWLSLEAGTAAPRLLSEALLRATGGLIAVTTPACAFPPDWLASLQRVQAREESFSVFGGAVEQSGDTSWLAWAAHFADYGAFRVTAERRETSFLAGNHVIYRREVLEGAAAFLADGYRKTFLHQELERQLCRFLFTPELVLCRAASERFGQLARRYFREGAGFAARRSRGLGLLERLARAAACPLLAAVLFFRRIRAGWEPRAAGRILAASLPVAAWVVCWSAGEAFGYLSRGGYAPTES